MNTDPDSASPIYPASPATWTLAEGAIRSGAVVAFPTDTVYGIGCNAYDARAIEAIYRLKGRPSSKALPLLLSSPALLEQVTRNLSYYTLLLAQTFWPGALTLVVERQPDLPEELSGDHTIAVRVPDHSQLRTFLNECGGFLATTSANLSGHPEAMSANVVSSYFPRGLAVIVDGGKLSPGPPSTVVDCTRQGPVLLREGALSRAEIERLLHMPLNGPHV